MCRWSIKAQVKTGGRGKAGGVKLATDADDASRRPRRILGLDIKGHTVRRVLVTPASKIAEEYYFSFLLDRTNRTFLAMASAEGGMEIEQLAVERPEALAKVPVDANDGVDLATAKEIVAAANFPAEIRDAAAEVVVRLWETFVAEDATLVEVNPLVRDPDGQHPRAGRQGHARRERRRSGTPGTPTSSTPRRRTHSRRRRRPRTSTTSSSTARSASSATAPAS